jgi:hypothetical protein
MLISSILQILDGIQAHAPPIEIAEVEPFKKVLDSVVEEQSTLKDIEGEIPEALELWAPFMVPPAPPVPRQSMEELIRAVTKFDESEHRVVDVFK